MRLYTVLDKKVGFYSTPFFQPTDAAAIRSFENEIKSGNAGLLSSNPDDFILFSVGDFDETTGLVTGCDLVNLKNGSEVLGRGQAV